MNEVFVFLQMIFNHILADFNLQGVLASFKQKDWWLENYPDFLYKDDYKVSLLMHSIEWTFLIMLPLAVYCNFNINFIFVLLFMWNVFIHYNVDDTKANLKYINLIQDQFAHIIQILITFILYYVF